MEKKTSYSDKLKDPRWQKKRLEIMNRDEFTCQLCNDKETTLNVHHKQYTWGNNPWEYPDDNLITYCEHCHKLVEAFKEPGYGVLSVHKIRFTRGVYWLLSNHENCGFAIHEIDPTNNVLEYKTIFGSAHVPGIVEFLNNGKKPSGN